MNSFRCTLYMEHTEELANRLVQTSAKASGEEILDALYLDQHSLYHDGEFVGGCAICDQEREESGW